MLWLQGREAMNACTQLALVSMMGWPGCMSAFPGHTVTHRCLVDANVCTLLGRRW